MTKQAKGRVIQLDFIRGVAILLVMDYHFLTVPTNNLAARSVDLVGKRLGWIGVDLFFVLSGFLIGGLLTQELCRTGSLHVSRFFVRRALKIWPAYYAYIFFQLIARKHPPRSFFWQNFFNIQNYTGTTLNHTWSLAVEEHFYLFLPPVLWLLYRNAWTRRHLAVILLTICGAILLERTVGVYVFNWPDPQWFTHARIDSLLFGVILSWVFAEHRVLWERLLGAPLALAAIAALGLVVAFLVGHHRPFMWSFGYTLNYLAMAALLLLVYSYKGRFTESRVYRLIAWIGLYSYGIYLWHLSVREPINHLVMHLPVAARWSALFVGQYVAAIALGILMTRLVELPMIHVRDRLFPRTLDPRSAAAAVTPPVAGTAPQPMHTEQEKALT